MSIRPFLLQYPMKAPYLHNFHVDIQHVVQLKTFCSSMVLLYKLSLKKWESVDFLGIATVKIFFIKIIKQTSHTLTAELFNFVGFQAFLYSIC